LAQALDRQWESLGDGLEALINQRRQALSLLEQARARGRADLIPQLEARQAVIERAWRQANVLAQNATSAPMRAYLQGRVSRSNQRLAEGRQRLSREAKLLAKLEKSAFGPSWRGVISECQALVRETESLRYQTVLHLVDLGVALSAWRAHKAFEEMLTSEANKKQFQMLVALVEKNYTFIITPFKVDRALEERDSATAMQDAALAAIEIAASMAVLLGAKTSPPVHLAFATFHLGLDAAIYRNLALRLREADRLRSALETGEAPWRQRVAAAQKEVLQLEREKELAARQLSRQRALTERVRRLGAGSALTRPPQTAFTSPAAMMIAPAAAREEQPPAEAYAFLWMEAVNNFLVLLKDAHRQLLANPSTLDSFEAQLKTVNDTVAKLFEAQPAIEDIPIHLRVVPLYAEVLSAARALAEAMRRGDDAAIAAGQDWLERAALELHLAIGNKAAGRSS
jgi:hypothetical protein